jgi:hypothetical protein
VDYTREPIVETVITPKDGYRIAVRSSKVPGQEEYIVEALEVVSFGTNCFFRNLERPKAFMVPASDYEVLEIREPRVPLKAAILEGTVRAPVPREMQKPAKEVERRELPPPPKEVVAHLVEPEEAAPEEEAVVSQPASSAEGRHDRRRERRRGQRRRRGVREEGAVEESRELVGKSETSQVGVPHVLPPTSPLAEAQPVHDVAKETPVPPVIPSVIPPPTTLIRDDLERLRKNKEYEGAFYIRQPEESEKEESDDDDAPVVPLRLQGEEEAKTQEEPAVRPHEDIYKATPAPLEEEES